MNLYSEKCCPLCAADNIRFHTHYFTKRGEQRTIYQCQDCQVYFSETYQTPLAGLRTPLSKIIEVLDALNDGMGLNAAVRTFKVAKNTIYDWLERVADLKEVLLLYALCHRFLSQLVEGDELYTKVKENKPPDQSTGWTIVLMERASRFIWEMKCGQHDRSLFQKAIETLRRLIAQTQDLTLVSDGERRYGNLLFEICRQALRTGQVGRPRQDPAQRGQGAAQEQRQPSSPQRPQTTQISSPSARTS